MARPDSDASAHRLLRIDEERAVRNIRQYIRELIERQSAGGILVGLSGGIDSVVLTALSVGAVGSGSVRAMYLYDRHSDRRIGSRARQVADSLGIAFRVESIEPAMKEKALYNSFAMRLFSVSAVTNRLLHGLYRTLSRESPFVTSLRLGAGAASGARPQRFGAERLIMDVDATFIARHVHRRAVLEGTARSENLLLLGCANRTELLLGWFVKGGVDDLPVQPLIGFYKTQIRQLAAYLRVADEVRTQPASPDMLKGITDEFALGMRYGDIDIALDYIGGGISRDEVAGAGITDDLIEAVRTMNRLSGWKRGVEGQSLPVDGGPQSVLRLHELKPVQ